MKIGIVAMGLESSRDFKSAGVARYAYALLDALADKRFSQDELHFFLLPSLEIPTKWQTAEHVQIHRTWKRYNKWTLLASGGVAKLLGLDFLFTTANTIPIWSPVPTGVFIHDLFPLDHPEWFPEATSAVNQKTIPRAVLQSHLVLANSESTRQDVLRHFSFAEGKVEVTPLAGGNEIHPLKPEEVDRSKLVSIGIPFKKFILTLSTIEPRKNLGRLLEAFARVAQLDNYEDVGLVVAGSKGWKYDDALAKIGSLGLEERVVLPGYVDDKDLPLLFGGAEFYICPSLSEGFGMPLVEAMAAGAPVLSSTGGALTEVGGDAVRYFDPLNVDSMASAMIQALDSSESRQSWIDLGLAQAALFTWDRTAQKTIDFIHGAATK